MLNLLLSGEGNANLGPTVATKGDGAPQLPGEGVDYSQSQRGRLANVQALGEADAVILKHHRILTISLAEADSNLARPAPWEGMFQGICHQLVDNEPAWDSCIDAQQNVLHIDLAVDVSRAETIGAA